MTNLNIPNFSSAPVSIKPQFNIFLLFAVLLLGLASGLLLGKLQVLPKSNTSNSESPTPVVANVEEVTKDSQIEVGKTYGTSKSTSKDKTQGVVKTGNINGVGTHILERQGGQSQWASLTSSALDLDLFVGRQVEVTGQTNSAAKTGWLLDVDQIKVLQ